MESEDDIQPLIDNEEQEQLRGSRESLLGLNTQTLNIDTGLDLVNIIFLSFIKPFI